MRVQNLYITVAFAAATAIAGSASAQPPAPPTAPGAAAAAPIAPAPVEPAPIGPFAITPGVMRLPSLATLVGPMMIDMPAIRTPWREEDRQDRDKEAEQRERDRESRVYDQAKDDIDNGRYDRAIERLSDVAGMKGAHAEAALYNKAWAQDRVGQRAEALATLATLMKEYPKGRYLTQAKALDQEARSKSGQPVRAGDQSDEDLKLYAIAALQNSDPEQAVPMLEKLLEGTASPRVKSKALFVLAQSNSA